MNLPTKPLNILFVENSDEDIELILAELQRGGYGPRIEQVTTDEEMRTALQKGPWDLILCDHSMPQFDSLSALNLYKESGLEIPFVIISGTMKEEVAAQAMNAGAHDYLSKCNLVRLVPIIQRELHQVELRLKLKRAKEAIKQKNAQTIAFHTALLRLASQAKPDLEVALKEILKTDAEAINVERVSFWSVQTDILTCESLYLKTQGSWERGLQLHQMDYPKYFECLEKNPIIVASDAQQDSRTGEFTDNYLRPFQITSMLDVPVWSEGKLVGVVCHEHVGPRRDWTEEEEKFALSIGHMVALALGEQERKIAETKLRESEEILRKTLDALPVGVWMVDAGGNLASVNPAGQKIWGGTKDLGIDQYAQYKGWWVSTGEQIKPEEWASARATKTGEISLNEVINIECFDGTKKTIYNSAVPIRDGSETIIGAIVVNEDITERLNLESQLRHAQKMESIGQLAGGVAHDFNNILTIIQGHSSLMLSSETLQSTDRDSAKQISLAAERATNLTRQLLTFSRRQIIQTRALDLNEVVNNISKMLRRLLGEDVCLQVNYSANVPTIFADQGMVEQVLMNLAVNSRDAMPKGGHLVISTSTLLVDQTYAQQNPDASIGEAVCLTVTDSGCGISAENLSRIYEPFFTTKAVGQGTGLGLATVYGIVKQHSGWIKVQSEVGKGTTFQIYFPGNAEKKVKPERSTEKFILRGGTETILLVEDESPVRNLVQQILKKLGYAVLEADSAVAALKVWKQHRDTIHLVLTDMVMPDGMTGRELAEIVQFDRPEIKVIYTSGYNAEIVGKDFILHEGLNFLQKPYQPKKLAKAVRDCLDNHLVPV